MGNKKQAWWIVLILVMLPWPAYGDELQDQIRAGRQRLKPYIPMPDGGPVDSEERSIEVTAYDGSDHRNMPLTFKIMVKEDGKPLANEPVRLEFVGETRCLADRWARRDNSSQKWLEIGDGFVSLKPIVEGDDAPRTDADGQVFVRAFLDFTRMRLLKLSLSQRIGLKASVESGKSANPKRVTAGATMVVRHGAFIRALYHYTSGTPGSLVCGPLVSVSDLPAHQERDLTPNGPNSWPPRPEQQEGVVTRGCVRNRVTIGGVGRIPEELVAWSDFYFGVPAGPGVQLMIDARPDKVPRSRSYLPVGSGIGVKMLWLDGTEGIFMVRAPGVLTADIFGVPNSSMTTGGQTITHTLYFVIGQGADFFVKKAVVGAATAVGGPVAGGVAFVIVAAMTGKDIIQVHKGYLPKNGHLVKLRSEVAITCSEQGSPVLYVFQGSPGVIGADGTEAVVTDGQSIKLLPGGAVGEVRQTGPDGRAAAMRDALQTDSKSITEPVKVKNQKKAKKLLQQARTQWDEGDLDRAITTLRKAEELDPDNKEIVKALESMGRQKDEQQSHRPKTSPPPITQNPQPAPQRPPSDDDWAPIGGSGSSTTKDKNGNSEGERSIPKGHSTRYGF